MFEKGMALRRSDRELTDRADIDDVINRARICHLALCKNNVPYAVPMNYGYADGCLYFHSAKEGKKIDILRSNNSVSFTIYVDERHAASDAACKWSTKYKSVIGEGKAFLVEEPGKKEAALAIIMRHYSDREFTFDPLQLNKAVIIKVIIDSLSGKQSV
jgi:nitroimidazol reductase NimA-like FMN-containing flavoprotein (pyridoxamine 5'-phosphate oxidase superfamily)